MTWSAYLYPVISTCAAWKEPATCSEAPTYVVVVSDEPFNHLSTVVVVPLSTGAKQASFRPQFRFGGETTRALPEQIRALDRRRLKEYRGNIAGTSFFGALRQAVRLVLALDEDTMP